MRKRTCLQWAGGLVCLWLLSGVALAGGMKAEVYPIVFGDPDAMVAVAESIVGEEGHVVLDRRTSRIITLTTPERHEMLAEVLRVADAVGSNVRVEVRFIEEGQERDQRAAVDVDGDIVIGPDGTDSRITLRPEVRYRTTETTSTTTQQLLVSSGREGVLRVGERVPYLDWITEYGWQYGYTQSRVRWEEVGSFLVVTPTILSDGQTVHLTLTPELRGRVAGGEPYHTRFASLATEVTVRNGQTFRLGGNTSDQTFYSRFLFGIDRSGARRALDIELTPRIIHPDGTGQ